MDTVGVGVVASQLWRRRASRTRASRSRAVAADTQLAADLHAGHLRQHQIQQDQVSAATVELGQRLRPGGRDGDLEALFAQHVGQGVRPRLFVLHDQYPSHPCSLRRRGSSGDLRVPGWAAHRAYREGSVRYGPSHLDVG